jgi:hypothetical protein
MIKLYLTTPFCCFSKERVFGFVQPLLLTGKYRLVINLNLQTYSSFLITKVYPIHLCTKHDWSRVSLYKNISLL